MNDDSRLRARVVEVLRESAVFGTLEPVVIDALADVLKLQTVHGGDVVVQEGDLANSMFFVINGGLRVSRRDASGNLLLYNEVRPGESFGETGLILKQPRAANVTALRDSTLAVLDRVDFDALLILHPGPLNRVFVQAIYNFLRHTAQPLIRRSESVAVVPLGNGSGAAEVARGLEAAFSKLGSSKCLSIAEGAPYAIDHAVRFDELERNSALEDQFEYLVYECEPSPSDWTRRALRQSDQVVFVVESDASREVEALERQLMNEPGYAMKRRHWVVLHPANTEQPDGVGRWRTGRDIERVYPTRRGHAGDYERLARFLTGRAVGVVLGGGGARGFAHLGVLRALHESGIAVDLIGGNSMGALIGAQYACGVDLDQIRIRTQKFAAGGERPTLPFISLVSGQRVRRDLVRMFGDRQVDGLWLPFFAAACNLTKGCTTVQDSGPIWKAVLASNSPAGLFPPVLHGGDLLVDGAILENVPVGAMRMRLGTAQEKRRGNGTIIAVDVDVQEELSVSPELQRLSVWSALKGKVFSNAERTPGIGEIMYRAGHIGGLNKRADTIEQSDHYLEPPVSQYSMMGYRYSADIAEIGYRYTMERIGQWKF